MRKEPIFTNNEPMHCHTPQAGCVCCCTRHAEERDIAEYCTNSCKDKFYQIDFEAREEERFISGWVCEELWSLDH